jgi:hemerythrin
MTALNWNPAWETGIEAIDGQHRSLLAQFEGLITAIHENHPLDQIPGLLTFLSDYVEFHFTTEEGYMLAGQYPGYDGHKASHDDMRARVVQLIDSYRRDPAGVAEGLVNFLTDLLVGHIDDHDRSMARFLLRMRVAQTGGTP